MATATTLPSAGLSCCGQDDSAVVPRIAISGGPAGLYNIHRSTVLRFEGIFWSRGEEGKNSILSTLLSQESCLPHDFSVPDVMDIQNVFADIPAAMMRMGRPGRFWKRCEPETPEKRAGMPLFGSRATGFLGGDTDFFG